MSWPTARAAIASELTGLTTAVSGLRPETLTAYEYAPAGRQDVSVWPYAFVLPTAQSVSRGANGLRISERDVQVRVMLAPVGESQDMESLHKQYDAWVESLKDALDGAVTFGGAAIFGMQEFGALALFEDIDHGWGFQLTLGTVRIHEAKTFTA